MPRSAISWPSRSAAALWAGSAPFFDPQKTQSEEILVMAIRSISREAVEKNRLDDVYI
jgi:hypothetical protein